MYETESCPRTCDLSCVSVSFRESGTISLPSCWIGLRIPNLCAGSEGSSHGIRKCPEPGQSCSANTRLEGSEDSARSDELLSLDCLWWFQGASRCPNSRQGFREIICPESAAHVLLNNMLSQIKEFSCRPGSHPHSAAPKYWQFCPRSLCPLHLRPAPGEQL